MRDQLRRLKATRRVERLDTVLGAMLSTFGGINGFTRALVDLQRNGSPADRRLVIDVVAKLTQAQHAAQEAERTARQSAAIDLQDKRLQAELERMALDHLRRPGSGSISRLGTVITARLADLRRAGWKIEPPSRA
jgi:hypothetical protein